MWCGRRSLARKRPETEAGTRGGAAQGGGYVFSRGNCRFVLPALVWPWCRSVTAGTRWRLAACGWEHLGAWCSDRLPLVFLLNPLTVLAK